MAKVVKIHATLSALTERVVLDCGHTQVEQLDVLSGPLNRVKPTKVGDELRCKTCTRPLGRQQIPITGDR